MSNFLTTSFIWVFFSELVYNLASYLVQVVMGRTLGPADYGRFGIIVTLTTMTVVLIGQSVPTAMSKYLSEIFEHKKGLVSVIKKQTIKIQVLIIGAVTVLFFLFSPVIAWALGDPSLTNLFRLSTLIIPLFAAASFYFSYYTGLHKFKIQSFLKASRGLWRIVFIIGLALFFKHYGLALQGAVLGYVAAPATVFLTAWLIDRIKVSKEFSSAPSETQNTPSFDWKKLAVFAWPVTIFLVAYQLLNTIDLYLVKGIMHSDFQTGIYNAAYTVGTIPYNLFYALTIILLPAVSKSTANNKNEETKKIISQSLRFLIMFLLPACILMSYFSLPIINLFYSSKYALSAPIMSVYVIAEGFLTIFYVLTFILNGAGKVKIPMYVSILGLFLNTFITYFLIKSYGLMGAAGGTAFMAFSVMVFGLVYTHREFGYVLPLKSSLRIVLASVVMLAFAFLFPRNSYLFILWSLILFAAYMTFLYLLREIKKDDLEVIRGMMKRKKLGK